MSGLDSSSKEPSTESKAPPKRRFSPFTGRTKAMSSSGWETYTVGFTLVGFIAAGAIAGWWLDSQFGTTFWLPVLFFVGVFGGFREMFRVVRRTNEEQTRKKREEEARKTIYTPPKSDGNERIADSPRERIFSVPPPPLEGQATPKDVPETTEELIARLLEDDTPEKSAPDSDETKPSK